MNRQRLVYLISLAPFVLAAFTWPHFSSAQAATPTNCANPNAAFPITIESCGQSFTFDEPPSRVVVTFPTMVDTLVDLGLGDRIVGIAQSTGGTLRPEDQGGLANVPSLGDGPAARETMLAARPDFVFADGDYNFDAESGYATYDDLRAIDATAYTSFAGCSDRRPTGTVEDLVIDITNLGRIFGITERADALVEKVSRELADLQSRIGDRARPTTAYIGFYGDQNYAYAGGIYQDLIALGGGSTVFSDISDTYAELSSEQLLARQPEVLVISYALESDIATNINFATERFPSIPAVLHDRFVLAEEGATCPGSTRQLIVLMTIAAGIHPDAFSEPSGTPAP